MPRVKIDTPGVTVELDANEVSVDELRKQAMETFKEATEVQKGVPSGPAFGFGNDRRWTPDHNGTDGRGRYGGPGFEPVQLES